MRSTEDEGSGGHAGGEVSEKVMAVLDGIPGLVAYWDQDLRNHLANAAYLDSFGVAPDRIRGTHIRVVIGGDPYAVNLPFMRAALRGEEQMFDRTIVDASGRTRFTQASYIPDHRDGVVHGFFVLVTDVTRRVIAERAPSENIDQYRALARSMPSGFVLMFDEDLRFLIADGPQLSTFGYTRESLEGHRMQDTFPSPMAAELEPRYRAALQGESRSWERVIGRRTFTLDVGPVRHDDGEVVSGMVLATDISAERTNQRTLRALLSIATEVARLAQPEAVAPSIASTLVDLFAVDSAAAVRFTGPDSAEVLSMVPDLVPGLSRQLSMADPDGSASARVLATGLPALVRYPVASGEVADRMNSSRVRAGLAAPSGARVFSGAPSASCRPRRTGSTAFSTSSSPSPRCSRWRSA